MRRTATLAILLIAAPAAGHHMETPPVIRLTSSGDNNLPRVPALSTTLALALSSDPSLSIYSIRLFDGLVLTLVNAGGNNANPSAAVARAIAFDSDGDPLGSGDPGRQVFLQAGTTLLQVTHDPSGTSANPAVNAHGNRLAFESAGDLTGTGSVGTLQVYFRDSDGSLVQLSRGQGTSRNPSISRRGTTVAFDSTSDPVTGLDTGLAQVWLSSRDPTTSHAITGGQGPSRNPLMANGGRIVVFESDADLANGGANTGVPQIFAYDMLTGNFAQVTQDSRGCTGASAQQHSGDWRIVFTCGGQGFYHDLRVDHRYRLAIDVGDTNRVVTGAGYYFLTLSTTADLLGTGTTAGHQIYLLNLFKRPAQPVSGSVVWFPARGLTPLR